MNKNALKKNHFWVLVGLAPLLALAAVGLYVTEIGAEVEKNLKDIDTKTKEVQGAKANGKLVLTKLDAQKDELTKKKDELWIDNWKRQSVEYRVFDWPQDNDAQQRLKRLAQASTKFGTPLENENDVFQVFTRKEVYEHAYEKAAEAIRPTGFPNQNWRNVLRHVSNWGAKTPKWWQLWLALEDLWVQRALLLPVVEVNKTAARFDLVRAPDGGEPPPLARTFRSPVWEIELSVVTDPASGKRVLKSKLTNRTDRMQFFGLRNTMRLHVWFSDRATAQPALYRIEGEFVKARETKDVPVVAKLHEIPGEVEVDKIARVEQVLDERTVPVKQVLDIELGANAKDARTPFAAELKAPEFFKEDPALAAVPGGPPGTSGPPGVPPSAFGGDGFGGPGATAVMGKGGTPLAVIDMNRKRYLDITPQVRRMPVRVVLLVDQLFMQDALTAYTNSPLRFQITQTFWTRFRGTLPPPAETPDFFDSPTARIPGTAPGFAGEAGSPPAGFAGAPPTGFGFPGGAAGTLSTVSEGQLTSGLIELYIYGTISLYEKYEEPKKEEAPAGAAPADPAAGPMPPAGTPAAPGADAAKEPKGPVPAPGTETPKEPQGPVPAPGAEAPKAPAGTPAATDKPATAPAEPAPPPAPAPKAKE